MRSIPDVARWQDGVFTRAQAARAGMSYRRINRLITDQEWRVVVATAFVSASTSIGPRQVARALMLLTGGVVSHGAAAALYGMDAVAGFHVTVDPRRNLRAAGIEIHQHPLAAADVVDLNGLHVTSRMRTVVDVLASIALVDARTFYYRAVQRDWLRRVELAEAVRHRTGWRGTPQLLQLLAESVDGAHSWLEARLILLLKSAGIRGWVANAPVSDASGLIGIADILFPGARLIIEVDGRRYHDADRFQSDRTRQNRLVRAGYTVLRFTYDDIVRRPEHVVRVVQQTLAALEAS